MVEEIEAEAGSLKAPNFSQKCDLILRDISDPQSYLSKPPVGSRETLRNYQRKGEEKAKEILEK